MTPSVLESFLQGAIAESGSAVLTTTALRCLPFAGAALLMDRLARPARLATLLWSGTFFAIMVLFLPRPWQVWAQILCAYLYFAVVSCCAWAWSRRKKTVGRWPLSVTIAVVAMVIPGLVFPGSAKAIALTLGFEFFFSVYSYLEERRSGRASDDLGDCVMFLMVNPTLVYSNRGVERTEPAAWGAIAARFAVGVAALFMHYVGQYVVPLPYVLNGGASLATQANGFVSLGLMWVQLIIWYWAHSGTASIQIAGMRALGWEVPERYRFPFLARSPEDFWKRWNIYLGQWFYKYVFLPVGLQMLRARKSGSGDREKALAVLAAFGLCGLVHDVNVSFSYGHAVFGATLAFLFGGTVVVLWAWGTKIWRKMGKEGGARLLWIERLGTALSPLMLACLITLMGWVFLPALAGQSVSAVIAR